MAKLNEDTTSEELGQIALHIVSLIDYDLWKEFKNAIEEDEYPWELVGIEDYLAGLVV